MKTENEFNAFIGKEIRKLEPHGYLLLKVAEKYHIGVPDFFLWHNKSCAAIEAKFVREMPKRGGLVLKHAFDGRQVGFLRRVAATSNPAWGIIAIHEEKRIVALPYNQIPDSGNWNGTLPEDFRSYHYDQVADLAGYFFYGWDFAKRK